MNCQFEEDLTAYLDHQLDPLREKQVALHLEECDSCQATHGLLSRTLKSLAQLPEFQTSPHLRRSVLAKVEQEPAPLGHRFWAFFGRPVFWAPAAAICATLLVIWVSQARHMGKQMNPAEMELASNLELAQDLDLLGTSSPEDVDVVLHLQELERTP